jgi:hypothetical protein
MNNVVYPKQFQRVHSGALGPPQNLLIGLDVCGVPMLALYYEGSKIPEIGKFLPVDPHATVWVLGYPERLIWRYRVIAIYDAAQFQRAELVLKCLHKLGIVPRCSTDECKEFQKDFQTGTLLPLPIKD